MGFEWSPALSALVGAAAGGALSTYLTLSRGKRTRLEDAYADFIGAAELVRQMSTFWVTDEKVPYEDLFTRFHHQRARLLLQEDDAECRAKVASIADLLNTLYTKLVYLDETEEEKQQHVTERHINHLNTFTKAKREMDGLLEMARRNGA